MTSIYHRAYLHGYARKAAPRWLRRLIARSEIHRAWLSGWLGFFESDGVAYSPAFPYPQFAEAETGAPIIAEGFPYRPEDF